MTQLIYYTNLVLMAVAMVTAFRHFSLLDKGARVFSVYLAINFICEMLALFVVLEGKDNNGIFNGFEGIKAFLLLWYFREAMHWRYPVPSALWIGIPFMAWSFGNVLYLDNRHISNNLLLVVEGMLAIVLAIRLQMQLSRLERLKDNTSRLHLLLSGSLLFFWCTMLLGWLLLPYHDYLGSVFLSVVTATLLGVNFIFYSILIFAFSRVKAAVHQFN